MRPDLEKNMSVDEFKKYYYLKEELQAFCKSNNLPINGKKEDLNERIIYFLTTGKVLKKKSVKKNIITNITLSTPIGDNFSYSEIARSFFVSYLGEAFSFKVCFQRWLKANPDKTFKDAIDIYPSLIKEDKNTKIKQIDRQFEYNTYIRDFFLENKNLTLKDAIECWKYKKSISGSNKYEASDLKILEK